MFSYHLATLLFSWWKFSFDKLSNMKIMLRSYCTAHSVQYAYMFKNTSDTIAVNIVLYYLGHFKHKWIHNRSITTRIELLV